MKKGIGVIVILIGIFILAGGIYLFPATMWRTFSIGMIVIGMIALLAGILLLVKGN